MLLKVSSGFPVTLLGVAFHPRVGPPQYSAVSERLPPGAAPAAAAVPCTVVRV